MAKEILTIEEAAELLGETVFSIKVSRQRGLSPGRLGFVEEGNLLFRRSDLLDKPKAERARKPAPAYPRHKGGGFYELSDGSTVRGKDAAAEAQAKLG